MEVIKAHSGLVIYETFKLLNLEEDERVLTAVSSATCSLDLYPFWFIKAS